MITRQSDDTRWRKDESRHGSWGWYTSQMDSLIPEISPETQINVVLGREFKVHLLHVSGVEAEWYIPTWRMFRSAEYQTWKSKLLPSDSTNDSTNHVSLARMESPAWTLISSDRVPFERPRLFTKKQPAVFIWSIKLWGVLFPAPSSSSLSLLSSSPSTHQNFIL